MYLSNDNNDRPLLPFSDEFLCLFHNCINPKQQKRREIPMSFDELPEGETEFEVRNIYRYYLCLARIEQECETGKVDIEAPGLYVEIKVSSGASFKFEQLRGYAEDGKKEGRKTFLVAVEFTTGEPRERTKISESRRSGRRGPTRKERSIERHINTTREGLGIPMYFLCERVGYKEEDRKKNILILRGIIRDYLVSQKKPPFTAEEYDKFCRDRPLPLDW